MIKSSDKEFNNIYRILRVLDNQDYLAIDNAQNQYIFSQCQSEETMNSFSSFLAELQLQESNCFIKKHKECITVNNIKYFVFEAGKSQVIWAKNINPIKLKQPNFVFNLVRDSILTILDKILWFDTKMVTMMLSINNFWMIDGLLYFLLMPRIKKNRFSISKQQKRRSFSLGGSTITTLIDSQSNFVKKFGEIVQQIINGSYSKQKQNQSTEFIKQLLLKMINRQISLQQIKKQFKTHQLCLTKNIILRPHLVNKKIINVKRNSISHYSSYTQPSQVIKPRIKERIHFKLTNTNQKSISSFTENVVHYSRLFQMKSQSKQLRFDSMEKKQQESECQYSAKTKRYSSFATIQNGNNKRINQKGRVRYLNWIREAKEKRNLVSPIKQQVQYQSIMARRKFQQKNDKRQQKVVNLDEKLKEKLLTKMANLKFRHHETRNYLMQDKMKQLGQGGGRTQNLRINSNQKCRAKRIQSQQEIYDEQLQKIKLSVISELKNGSIEVGRVKQKERDAANNAIYQDYDYQGNTNTCQSTKQEVPRKIYLNQEPNLENMPIEKQDIRQLIDKNQKESQQKIQKVKLNKINSKTETIEQIALENRRQIKNNANEVQLNKSVKNTIKNKDKLIVSSEFQNLDDDLQIINLNNPPKQKLPVQSVHKIIRQQQNKTVAKNKSTQSENSKRLVREQQKIQGVNELIDEYLSILNILGDISVKIVHNKEALKNIQWRKPIYFIYQRFFFQRVQFLKKLKSRQRQKIVRRNRNIESKSWNAWKDSKDINQLITEVQTQNSQIQNTFTRFSNKICVQCKLQPNLLNLIKNRSVFVSSKVKNNRLILSKFAVALIINEYDKIVDQKCRDKSAINFILDCIFGLRIMAELDGFAMKSQLVSLQQYKLHKMSMKQAEGIIQQIYELYYPESDIK